MGRSKNNDQPSKSRPFWMWRWLLVFGNIITYCSKCDIFLQQWFGITTYFIQVFVIQLYTLQCVYFPPSSIIVLLFAEIIINYVRWTFLENYHLYFDYVKKNFEKIVPTRILKNAARIFIHNANNSGGMLQNSDGVL